MQNKIKKARQKITLKDSLGAGFSEGNGPTLVILGQLLETFHGPDKVIQNDTENHWMRLFYLQLRSFYLRFVFFTYGGGTVSKKDQTQFPGQGEP